MDVRTVRECQLDTCCPWLLLVEYLSFLLYCMAGIVNPAPGTTGCPTSFPHALLMGGSFNRSLWHAIATVISTEGRAIFNAVNRSSREWSAQGREEGMLNHPLTSSFQT